MNLLQSFPTGFTPNSQQEKIITQIELAFKEGYKFVVCCAPTGTGKSFISKTLANSAAQPSKEYTDLVLSYNAFKRNAFSYEYEEECNEEKPFGAFALTITKSLQDQYQELFNETKVLKGKNNYACNIAPEFTADYAPCLYAKNIKNECWKKNCCTYYSNRNESLVSKFATLNYKMFFSLPNHVKKRQYLVCDEASELEEELIKEFSCIVDLDTLDKYNVKTSTPALSNYVKMQQWVGEVSGNISHVCKNIEDGIASIKQVAALEKEKEKLVWLKGLQTRLEVLLDTWHNSEYIIEKKEDKIHFTPLKVDKLSSRLFSSGDKVVLLSATIIDHKTFCDTLGITNYKYIEVDSTFDPKKAPIYIASKIKLNSQNLQSKLPNILRAVEKICNHHKTDKGLIHTHTNEITRYLKNNLTDESRYLARVQGVSNEEILQDHKDSIDPTVLISPSLVYGVDLKDDLARFQIIVKAPYAPLIDKRIKTLCSINPQWYTNKMLTSVIQMCGRGIRSSEDYCITYIIDGNIADNVIRNVKILPKYFLNRFV